MKKIMALLPLIVLGSGAQASTSYGALGNFDAVNDTGVTCYGFEIEIDDAHSQDIGGTYTYNHYGVPKIREDLTNSAHPKVRALPTRRRLQARRVQLRRLWGINALILV
jgi:hypothetical protein